MLRFITRHRVLIGYLGASLFVVGTSARYLLRYIDEPRRAVVIGLLGAFLLLFLLQPWLSKRHPRLIHLYLGLQVALCVALASMPDRDDFFSNLFVVLALQAAYTLPSRVAFRWIGAFALLGAALLVGLVGVSTGLPIAVTNTVAVYLIGSWMALIAHAEAARLESERLLGELRQAHGQLQLYTAQAEELAVIEDRNRLARTLHDSVSQTIFSMRLTADAARILLERDPAQVSEQLERLQQLAESALVSMRALIHELRPTAVSEQGLVPALRRLFATLERQQGLVVSFAARGEPDLPGEQAEQLYRIVQEALNNVLKHAGTDKARVILEAEGGRLTVRIEDDGRGFTPAAEPSRAGAAASPPRTSTSLGLSSMRERAELLGASLQIQSRPGEGTRITVEVQSG